MRKRVLCLLCILACVLCGCASNEATVDVLERCKIIGSVITETSISEDHKYLTITFENGVFYCEDTTNSAAAPTYTIKVPVDKECNVFSIMHSIASTMTEEDFQELEDNGEVVFGKAYKAYWRCNRSIEGDTIKYVIK